MVARHNDWTEGKRFLMVPYHMIGARDMESAILGGYAEHVRRACIRTRRCPAFYLAETLFADAAAARADGRRGVLRAAQRGPGEGGDGWGELERGWDARELRVRDAGAAARATSASGWSAT